jgi:hypothetical protein
MLDTTSTTLFATHPRQIRGIFLANARLPPRARARLAATWVSGSLTISKPTARQAADLFGVSEAPIRDEHRELEDATFAPSPIEAAWACVSDRERDAFVRDTCSICGRGLIVSLHSKANHDPSGASLLAPLLS